MKGKFIKYSLYQNEEKGQCCTKVRMFEFQPIKELNELEHNRLANTLIFAYKIFSNEFLGLRNKRTTGERTFLILPSKMNGIKLDKIPTIKQIKEEFKNLK